MSQRRLPWIRLFFMLAAVAFIFPFVTLVLFRYIRWHDTAYLGIVLGPVPVLMIFVIGVCYFERARLKSQVGRVNSSVRFEASKSLNLHMPEFVLLNRLFLISTLVIMLPWILYVCVHVSIRSAGESIAHTLDFIGCQKQAEQVYKAVVNPYEGSVVTPPMDDGHRCESLPSVDKFERQNKIIESVYGLRSRQLAYRYLRYATKSDELSDFIQAERCYQKSLSLYKFLDDAPMKWTLLSSLIPVQLELNKNEEARKNLGVALQMCANHPCVFDYSILAEKARQVGNLDREFLKLEKGWLKPYSFPSCYHLLVTPEVGSAEKDFALSGAKRPFRDNPWLVFVVLYSPIPCMVLLIATVLLEYRSKRLLRIKWSRALSSRNRHEVFSALNNLTTLALVDGKLSLANRYSVRLIEKAEDLVSSLDSESPHQD